MPAAPTQLDYAPRVKRPRRRWRRGVVATGFLAVLAAAGWHYRQSIVDRVHLLAAQRRCMTHVAAADTVVFDEDRQRGRQLVASDASYHQYFNGYSGFSTGLRRPDGTYQSLPSWELVAPGVLNGAGAAAFSPAVLAAPRGLIFAHERQVAHCDPRLVIVEVRADTHFTLTAHTLRPGNPFRRPVLLKTSEAGWDVSEVLELGTLFEDSTRVFPGQPDPNDSARFTFRATAHGVEIKVHGQLLPDDSVRIEIPNADGVAERIKHQPVQP